MMKENSVNPIPTLDGNAYQDHYFKHASAGTSGRDMYFEIHNRCILKNKIPSHRLDFFMIFLVTSGEGIHSFGTREYYIRKNMLCFIGPNVINSWRSENDENRGFFCSFSEDFFNSGSANKQFLSELPFFQIDGNAVIYLSDEQTEYYTSLFRIMEKEYQSQNKFSPDILRGYLQALIGKSRSEHSNTNHKEDRSGNAGLRLVKAFTTLYMNDVNTVRKGEEVKLKKVSDYADQLGVSQNHLNDTIKEITGQSAGRLMRDQIIRQATMCLRHSSKSISEIAYLLGFEDPSYFSRFYKKQTGKLPSEFR